MIPTSFPDREFIRGVFERVGASAPALCCTLSTMLVAIVLCCKRESSDTELGKSFFILLTSWCHKERVFPGAIFSLRALIPPRRFTTTCPCGFDGSQPNVESTSEFPVLLSSIQEPVF